jgi:hypothetical protein
MFPKGNQLYLAAALLLVALIAAYLIYTQVSERNAVADCAVHAGDAVKRNSPQSVKDGNGIYDAFFKACMGKRGFER